MFPTVQLTRRIFGLIGYCWTIMPTPTIFLYLLLGVIFTAPTGSAQTTYPPGTYAYAITSLSKIQLEEWLQRHVPGIVTYSGATASRQIDPGFRGTDHSQVEYASTTFRQYTWSSCTLVIAEAHEDGTWLTPPELHTTARVAMTDVDSVVAGVIHEGEGPVSLTLAKSARSFGNAAGSLPVRLLARYPLLVSRVLLRYSEMCKGHIP
jgi:hypothetical protein